MAYRVLYRKRAERDLAKLTESATLAWFDGVCEAVQSLAELPDRCAFAPEPGLRQRGVRQLLYGEGRSVYRILYRVRDESVQILTIRHAHRRPIKR